MKPKIVGVALKFENKIICSGLAPARHGNLINTLSEDMYIYLGKEIDDGFIDEKKNFLNRAEAKIRAIETKQYKPFNEAHNKSELCFSEDLW